MRKVEDGYKRFTKYGYVEIKTGNKFVYEHRYLMEKKLKRKLQPSEIVHHINGNKLDNRIENLVITNRPSHVKQHYIEDPKKQAQWNSIQHLGPKSLIKVQEPRPEPTEEGLRWNNHKNRHGYIVLRCRHCLKLFWARFDRHKYSKNLCKPCGGKYGNHMRHGIPFKFNIGGETIIHKSKHPNGI